MLAAERSPGLADLAAAMAAHVAHRPVPLLVLRLPQFERIAWRRGKRAAQQLERGAARAFTQSARQSLREQDLLAHDPDTDVFAAAILAGPRAQDRHVPTALDCRSALERIAAAMSLATGLGIETGWTLVRRLDGAAGLDDEIAVALERGLRERERYEFFATVGHELRTPLTSVRGYLETVLDGGLDAATCARFLETARRETLRLGRLVDNLFEFSLLDLSAAVFNTASCNLAAVVAHACEILAPAARARGIALINAAAMPVAAKIEEDACLQVVINLLDNAIKYGRERGCVRVGLRVDQPFVRLTVDDDGPGIAAGDREAIFGLRVRAARAQRPGTGIGLAIVRMIADRAGGEVSAGESALGGARFELALPLEAEFAEGAS